MRHPFPLLNGSHALELQGLRFTAVSACRSVGSSRKGAAQSARNSRDLMRSSRIVRRPRCVEATVHRKSGQPRGDAASDAASDAPSRPSSVAHPSPHGLRPSEAWHFPERSGVCPLRALYLLAAATAFDPLAAGRAVGHRKSIAEGGSPVPPTTPTPPTPQPL